MLGAFPTEALASPVCDPRRANTLVSLGLAIREQQGGPQIATAISTIAGGAIIIAASVYFGQLDTSWLPA